MFEMSIHMFEMINGSFCLRAVFVPLRGRRGFIPDACMVMVCLRVWPCSVSPSNKQEVSPAASSGTTLLTTLVLFSPPECLSTEVWPWRRSSALDLTWITLWQASALCAVPRKLDFSAQF